MIVPQYWAEARAQYRRNGKHITVRRFGWSDVSQAEAQAHAEQRAQEALDGLRDGEKLARREPKVPYNGAEGVPIREEIVARHDDVLITRNSYGARCLNSADVLFADIDFAQQPSLRFAIGVFATLAALGLLAGWLTHSVLLLAGLLLVALFASGLLAGRVHRLYLDWQGGAAALARQRILRFLERHPDWSFRLYRTPAGLRALATHRTFVADDPAVAQCFSALGVDPLYARMCQRQQCFRARLSAKPWRMGLAHHLKPRPGVWPVAPERLHMRRDWVERYEAAARGYAACSFLEVLGSGVVAPEVARVQWLHDELSGAASGRPIA
ncbi:hypothetical protein KRX52_16010 [Pseudomonas sp. MAP12]|uniref:Transmembrane protein n=1 Tax=Geopseudomonas aromaticivorans TaxID=2849492 RepID=A0ABS6N0U4_9GAMM|nr:hypothetical protein [Pseudomonas aromaticivorans]MBV2134284.1 hypothetical protein [Pseudomonas aromaticivorans]